MAQPAPSSDADESLRDQADLGGQRIFGVRAMKSVADHLRSYPGYEKNYACLLSCRMIGLILEASFDLVPAEKRKPAQQSPGFGARWVSENILKTHARSGYFR